MAICKAHHYIYFVDVCFSRSMYKNQREMQEKTTGKNSKKMKKKKTVHNNNTKDSNRSITSKSRTKTYYAKK